MPRERPGTALVTGASSGIGREIARLHAARGGDLVVVARRTDRLTALKRDLEGAHGVAVHVLPLDLSVAGAADDASQFVSDRGLAVDILVNNAGFGGGGAFAGRPDGVDEAMVRLNVEAPVALCRRFLPAMRARACGRVLNVASIVAFAPGPGMAVYAASKAFLLSFSEALAEECAGSGVTVTAFCPGLTATEFHSAAGYVSDGRTIPGGHDAHTVAQAGYAAMLAGRRIAFAETTTAVASVAPRFLPRRLVAALVGSMVRRRKT
jgi:short-subunit dehydrogenase